MRTQHIIVCLALAVAAGPALAAAPTDALVTRVGTDRLRISWTDQGGVDVYEADRPDATVRTARLISPDDRDGVHEQAVAPGERAYFLLRDHRSGGAVRVAERVVPLDRGSNFRDIGGYPAAGGKHVRWGMIFRSGATPMLDDADVRAVAGLHLTDMVDLRSSEERQLAPSRIEGVTYHAVNYSMAEILRLSMPQTGGPASPAMSAAEPLYRRMPQMLAPQMRLLFDRLLAKEGPVAYNCSAGQDRTGFATAMVLSALGVPRDVIAADYELSTALRRPDYEMPWYDPAVFPDNAAAKLFARPKDTPARKAQPLHTTEGVPFITFAFDEIDKQYGSVDAYLAKEAGVTPADLKLLRATYLE